MRLSFYRLRPVPWLTATGVCIAWFVLVAIVARSQTAPALFYLLTASGMLAGLGAAFTVSAEIDPAEPVLLSSPRPFWRTPGLRVLVWLVIGAALLGVLVAVTAHFARVGPFTGGQMLGILIPDFILMAGLSFVAASLFGSYVGGGVAMAGAALLGVAQSARSSLPVHLLDLPPTDPGQPTHLLLRWYLGRASLGMLGLVILGVSLMRLRWLGSGWHRSHRGAPESA